jgi:hypothetical protein
MIQYIYRRYLVKYTVLAKLHQISAQNCQHVYTAKYVTLSSSQQPVKKDIDL